MVFRLFDNGHIRYSRRAAASALGGLLFAVTLVTLTVRLGSAHSQPTSAGKPDPTPQDASRSAAFQQLIRQASECYKNSDFECAYTRYRQAYDISPQPLLLFNIGQVCRKAGQAKVALSYYEEFLRLAPQSELKAEVASYVRALRATAPVAEAPPAPSSVSPSPGVEPFTGTEEERQALFRQNIQAAAAQFAAGDVDAAVAAYWTAYTLKPQTLIIFNVAQLYRKAARWAQAQALYQRFLQEDPASALAPEVEGYLAEVQQRLREEQQEAERRAAQSLAQANAALAERLAGLERQQALLTMPERPKPVYRRAWFWALLGTTAAGVALGVGLGVGLQPKVPDVDLGAGTLRF